MHPIVFDFDSAASFNASFRQESAEAALKVGISGTFNIRPLSRIVSGVLSFSSGVGCIVSDMGFDNCLQVGEWGGFSSAVFLLRPCDWMPSLLRNPNDFDENQWKAVLLSRLAAPVQGNPSLRLHLVLTGFDWGLAPVPSSEEEKAVRVQLDKKLEEATREALIQNEKINVVSLAETDWAFGPLPLNDRYLITSEVFGKDAYFTLALELARLIMGASSLTSRIKHVFVDADNTLWEGIAADDGADNLEFKHFGPSSAHLAFQSCLASLSRSGVLVSLVSKNDYETIEQVFSYREDMLIKEADFFSIDAGWDSKSSFIASRLKESRIGEEAALFIDDSPFEVDEVRRKLGISSIVFEPSGIQRLLITLRILANLHMSQTGGVSRASSLKPAAPAEAAFEESAQAKVRWVSLDGASRQRFFELINKTNQFNLNGLRRFTGELGPSEHALVGRVSDDWVDFGQVVSAIILVSGASAKVTHLAMSCRVIGRGVEAQIDQQLRALASELGVVTISYEFVATPKNHLVGEWISSINRLDDKGESGF